MDLPWAFILRQLNTMSQPSQNLSDSPGRAEKFWSISSTTYDIKTVGKIETVLSVKQKSSGPHYIKETLSTTIKPSDCSTLEFSQCIGFFSAVIEHSQKSPKEERFYLVHYCKEIWSSCQEGMTWWQEQGARWSHCIHTQEAEEQTGRGQGYKLSNSQWHTSSFSGKTRFYFPEAPYPPQTLPPTEDQVFKFMSLCEGVRFSFKP